MHFGENQLSRSLIGLSPLPTAHPPSFQPRWVRSSTRSYTCFNLAMGRSPRFGSRPCHLTRPFRLALATATPQGLTSRHGANSQAHSSIGTPSPPQRKGSDGLQAPGFRYYFTPLPGYFSPFPHGTIRYRSSGGIQAAKWSWQIHTGFHEPRATRERAHAASMVSPTGLSPTTAPLPRRFSYHTSFSLRPPPAEDGRTRPTTPHTQPLPGITRTRFNHHPISLATTHGISSPTGTEMFHFPASPPRTL